MLWSLKSVTIHPEVRMDLHRTTVRLWAALGSYSSTLKPRSVLPALLLVSQLGLTARKLRNATLEQG